MHESLQVQCIDGHHGHVITSLALVVIRVRMSDLLWVVIVDLPNACSYAVRCGLPGFALHYFTIRQCDFDGSSLHTCVCVCVMCVCVCVCV